MTTAQFKGVCALAVPGGPWCHTFALEELGKLSSYIEITCWAPWIS